MYGCALAQTAGTAVMRLAGDDLLPFDFTAVASTIKRYEDEIQKLVATKQEEVRERNQEIEEGVFTALTDPKVTLNPPAREEVPPFLNFAPLQNAVDLLSKNALRYHRVVNGNNERRRNRLRRSTRSSSRVSRSSRAAMDYRDGLGSNIRSMHRVFIPAMASKRYRGCARPSSRNSGNLQKNRS